MARNPNFSIPLCNLQSRVLEVTNKTVAICLEKEPHFKYHLKQQEKCVYILMSLWIASKEHLDAHREMNPEWFVPVFSAGGLHSNWKDKVKAINLKALWNF